MQERDIVRLLIQFGSHQMPGENTNVATFILADIEESLGDFENPILGKIAQECYDFVVADQTYTQDYFFQHANPDISRTTIELLFEKDQMSHNWVERWNYPLQNQPVPELNFDLDARQALDRFKLRKLIQLCEVNQARIKAAGESDNFEELMRLMKIHQKMLEARNALAKKTGAVVLK